MRKKLVSAALAVSLAASMGLSGCGANENGKTTEAETSKAAEGEKTTEKTTEEEKASESTEAAGAAEETTDASEKTAEASEKTTEASEKTTEAAEKTTEAKETAASEGTAGSESGNEEAAGDPDIGNGELVLYTWEGMFPQEVLDSFEDTYGIRIIYSNFDTDETMLQKLSTAKGGDYDLVIADDYIIESAINEGLVQKLDRSKLSNWDNINPVYQGQFYDPEDAYTVPYGAGIPLIVYDPELVDCEITGYGSLWDESLKDSVALTANYRVIMGITLLSMGESMNTQDVSVIEKAGEKLKELAPNVRMIQDDNTQVSLLNGEASAAFLYTSQVYTALAENPDLQVCVPEEGLGYGVMAGFIPSQAPNASAAHLFLDYLLEPEVSAQCFEYLGYYCTNKAAEELISEESKALLVAPTGAKMEMIENVSSEADAAFNKAWTEFKAACD